MATDKTTLRRAIDGDVDLLVAWHADPEVSKYWDDHVDTLARQLLDGGWASLTVDPYVWNEQGIRGWWNAGFVEVSRQPADNGHTAEWVLMRFEDAEDLEKVPDTIATLLP